MLGSSELFKDGVNVDEEEGIDVGSILGCDDRFEDGSDDGINVGPLVGKNVGEVEGIDVGSILGCDDRFEDGSDDGIKVGPLVGPSLGFIDGNCDFSFDG